MDRALLNELHWQGIADERVLAAMGEVPRELFLPPEMRPWAWLNRALPIGQGQTISQPYIVARMTELLELRGGEKVLEIGTGSGYQTAVLSRLAREVWTLEVLADLAALARVRLAEAGCGNIHFRVGDGWEGWPEAAPFDAIIVTAAPEEVPEALAAQLAEGGRMVLPLGPAGEVQILGRIGKRDGELRAEDLERVVFVPMVRGNDIVE